MTGCEALLEETVQYAVCDAVFPFFVLFPTTRLRKPSACDLPAVLSPLDPGAKQQLAGLSKARIPNKSFFH